MKIRIQNLWERVRTSLWFVPAWLSAAAVGLAFLVTRVDFGISAWQPRIEPFLLYSGDIEGARLVLSTVAGSMITVAGVTFSVTMVALSLASSQLGPRLLQNFMRDRANQFVLGTFIATFLFCLVSLTRVSASSREVAAAAAVSLAVLLAVVSLAQLIYFIHHVSSSIHADHVVESVARELEQAVDRVFPPEHADEPVADEEELDVAHDPDQGETVWARAHRDGYIQAVDEGRLVNLAEKAGQRLRALLRPGHFVVCGEPLVVALGGREPPEEVAEALAQSFIVGRRRTQEQDPEYGVHQLVEVAVRALSPGVNDPYTAISCIDWLGAILCRVGGRPARAPRRLGSDGRPWLGVDPVSFEGLMAAAFNQIRQYAGATPAVAIHLLEVLRRIVPHLRDDARREAVRAQADMVFGAARSSKLQEHDRRDLDTRYRDLLWALEAPTDPDV